MPAAPDNVLEVWITDDGDRRRRPAARGAAPPPRPRWRDVAVVAAALAALVTAGSVLGDGPVDGGRRSVPPPAPVPSPAPRADRSAVAAGDQVVLGSLLPAPTDGTVLVVVVDRALTVIDVDAGTVRSLPPTGGRAAVTPAFARAGSVVMVGDDVRVTPVAPGSPTARVGLGWPAPAAATDRLWLGIGGTAAGLREHRLDGRPTGRVVALAPGAWVDGPVVPAGGGLAASVHGTVLLLDPDGGRHRDLGPGRPVAGAGEALALVRCSAELRCPLRILDVASGGEQAVPPPPGTWFDVYGWPTVAAPDGRTVAVRVYAERGGTPSVALVDLAARTTTLLPATRGLSATPAFSRDGRWLFFVTAELQALDLATGGVVPVGGIGAERSAGVVAVPPA